MHQGTGACRVTDEKPYEGAHAIEVSGTFDGYGGVGEPRARERVRDRAGDDIKRVRTVLAHDPLLIQGDRQAGSEGATQHLEVRRSGQLNV